MARYGSFMPIVSRHPISGARLRALRVRRELSQRDLAQLCVTHGRPVTQGQISRIEQGRSRRPYMPLVRALAKSLAVEPEDLLEEPMQ